MNQNVQPLIYIVDGNKSYRKVVAGCVEASELTNVEEFENGEQCYSANYPAADLIILDYNLGQGNWNGIEFMEEYQRLHNSTNFIFLSSNTGVEKAVESVRKGALDYILKSRLGLVRLTKKLDLVKQFHTKKQSEKVS